MTAPGPSEALTLQLATRGDAPAFAAHIVRHLAESGSGGAPHFAPLSVVAYDDVAAQSDRRWALSLREPGWGRAWMLIAPARGSLPNDRARVVGHVELRGSLVHSGLHRAELSIGLERAVRGAGHGRRLMREAVAFAAAAGLAYLDLKVFAHNAPARRLYEALGFRQVALLPDLFRMPDGARIDDVWMTLELTSSSGR